MTKFAFVSAERAYHAVSTVCRVVGVGVSGFYVYRTRLSGQVVGLRGAP